MSNRYICRTCDGTGNAGLSEHVDAYGCPSCGGLGYKEYGMTIRHPFLFLGFVVIMAVIFRACASPVDAMTLTPAGSQWVIEFQPHDDNVGVVVVTDCKSPSFSAYDSFPIQDPAQGILRARRQNTPKGARCTVIASIMRQKDDDPNHDVVGESVIVIQKDDGGVEVQQPAEEEYP